MNQLTPVTKWLLILNVGIFFGDIIFLNHAIERFGIFTIASAFFEGQIHKFISFQFLHGSVGHLLANMIGLYFFGPWMERYLGMKKFTWFYLVCGVGGALFFSLLAMTNLLPYGSVDSALLGASAGIYGILIGVAMIAPQATIRLLIPPVAMKMRTFAILILTIAVGAIVLRIGGNEGGEAGHLGGAMVGYLLMMFFMNSSRLIRRSKQPRTDIEAKIRPRTVVNLHSQTRIDTILEKISKDGFQSLTDEEREFLNQEAEKRNK